MHLAVFTDVQRPQLEAALLARQQPAGVEGHAGQVEDRAVHVDRDAAVVLQVQAQPVVDGVDRHRALRGQAAVVHEAHEAARAVAAMLDLVAGVVEDAVAEVGVGIARGLDQQDLVGAHAEAAVAQAAQLLGAELDRRAGGVEHDEVVAGALHLGELQSHFNPARPPEGTEAPPRGAASTASVGVPSAGLSRPGPARRVQYKEASPAGRVLKRLCTHRYWAGLWRISSSIQRFMRWAAATSSSPGKSSQGGRNLTR